MNDLYLTLGRTIARQCPTGFKEARLEASLGEAGGAPLLMCTPAEGGKIEVALSGGARQDIRLALEAVREKTAEQEGARWRSCTVTLIQGGGFKMDVVY